MTDSRETVWRKQQKKSAGSPTHCKHPVDVGICAAFVPAGSTHPHVCDRHVKGD